MTVSVTTSPVAPSELAQILGSELGITFFVRGIRVFIPESAGADEIGDVIDVLSRVAGESNPPNTRLKT